MLRKGEARQLNSSIRLAGNLARVNSGIKTIAFEGGLTALRGYATLLSSLYLCAAQRNGSFEGTTTMLSAADKAWVAAIIAIGSQYISAKFGVPMSPEMVGLLTAAGVYWTPNKTGGGG